MQINRNNYESFFIDYLDGALDTHQEADLLLFLEDNPDLKEELENFDVVTLEADTTIQYTNKTLLRKKNILSVGPINEQNYHEYLIGSIEGDLSLSERRFLERFILRNPSAAREIELYKATKFLPDPNVVYPEKGKLKKYPLWISYKKPVYYLAGVAATLLLLFMVFNPFSGKEPTIALHENTRELFANPSPNVTQPSDSRESVSGFTNDQNKDNPDASQPVRIQSTRNAVDHQPSPAPLTGNSRGLMAILPGESTYDHLSSIPPVHLNIRYQLINTSFDPAEQIHNSNRNTYSQALPYLVMTDQYALSSSQQNNNESFESIGEYAWNRFKRIFSGRQNKDRRLPNFTLWTLADIGVVGINQLTDSELHIQRIKDKEGNIISYALIKENQEITRVRSKNNPAQNNRYK